MDISIVSAIITLSAISAASGDLVRCCSIMGLGDQRLRVKSMKITLQEKHGTYYADVKVGDPVQVFSLIVDTGSSVTWLAGEQVKASLPASRGKLRTFYKEKSTTESGDLEQESKSTVFSGRIAQDIFKFDFEQQCPLEIDNCKFGVADAFDHSEGPSLREFHILDEGDGAMGLALAEEDSSDTNFFKSILRNVNIKEVFGLYLMGYSYSARGGMLVFGDGDKDLVDGRFTYHNVVKVGGNYNGWNIYLEKISVMAKNGTNITVFNEKTLAVLDSGSTIISGPTQSFNLLNKIIFEHASLDFDPNKIYTCDEIHKENMPKVEFTMGGKVYELPYENYIVDAGNDVCRTSLIATDSPETIVLGVPFLERFYTRFNMKERRVGFAKKKLNIIPKGSYECA